MSVIALAPDAPEPDPFTARIGDNIWHSSLIALCHQLYKARIPAEIRQVWMMFYRDFGFWADLACYLQGQIPHSKGFIRQYRGLLNFTVNWRRLERLNYFLLCLGLQAKPGKNVGHQSTNRSAGRVDYNLRRR